MEAEHAEVASGTVRPSPGQLHTDTIVNEPHSAHGSSMDRTAVEKLGQVVVAWEYMPTG